MATPSPSPPRPSPPPLDEPLRERPPRLVIDIKKSLPPGVTPEMALQFLKADPEAAKPFLPAGVTVEQAIARARRQTCLPRPTGPEVTPANAPRGNLRRAARRREDADSRAPARHR